MTDPKEKIKQELCEYLAIEEHYNKEDKLKLFMAIFEKSFIFTKTLHLITASDILLISGLAKSEYSKMSVPMYVGEKKMEYDDLRIVALTEAFIGYLNLNHLARKEIQINYKKSK
jgi:hypothetical protein